MALPSFPRIALFSCLTLLASATWMSAETVKDREGAVRAEKARLEAQARWYFDDFDKAAAEANRTGKPLLVVLRCVPCLACAGIDGAVMDAPELSSLLDEFVCVRIINANALDLERFQFDYDLSFSAIMMSPGGQIYGRYGSWRHQKDPAEKSIAGFRATLDAALLIHQGYPGNAKNLSGKNPKAIAYKTPLDIPLIQNSENPYRRELDWKGNVVKSCVHCHQIGDGLKAAYRDRGELLPLRLIYPMPSPETVGFSLQPDRTARIAGVAPGSPAELAGLERGDDIVSAGGQWIISEADFAWMLDHLKDEDRVEFQVNRGGETISVVMDLPPGWRMKSDIGRRVGTWPMRAMVGGGMKLEDLPDEERQNRNLGKGGLALEILHVGQYGKHAAAKRAGFQKGDILIEVDGLSHRLTESEYIGTLLQRHPGPAKLDAVVLRNGERVSLEFPMQ
ncbi:MAG: PDZ domain-containing protein [Verrucomicrobiae bacterium]|nr:PDZ domain-containing protein [Verrucomicrobiae bacterium]